MLNSTSTKSKKMDFNYWILAAVILIFFSMTSFNYPYLKYTRDFWEHTASLKELSSNLITPKNPHINSTVASPRYTIYLLFWAVFKKISGSDVFKTMALASIANILMFLTGLYYFIREYFKDKKLPFYMLIVMLFFWGGIFPWSNSYQFRTLIYNLSYPSAFSFACFLWGVYFIVRYLRLHKMGYYFLSILLSFVTFLCHPPTATLLFLTTIVLAIIEKRPSLKERILVILLPFLSVTFCFLWPYFSMYKLFFSTTRSSGATQQVGNLLHTLHPLHSKLAIIGLGPMLLGIFFIWNFIIQKKNWFITYCFLSCSAVYIISYYFPIPFGGRFIFFTAFYLHLAIAYKFRQWKLFSLRSLKQTMFYRTEQDLVKSFFIVISICAVAYNLNLTKKEYLSDFVSLRGNKIVFHKSERPSLVNKFFFLKDKIGTYEVVMSDPKTSWILPTFSGKVVSLLKGHDNPLIEDSLQRRIDNIAFFEEDASEETRRGLLSKYNVSYILLNPEFVDKEAANDIKKLGGIVAERNDLTLIKI
ncbi:hypothetical protein KKC91_02875 [bacterium]|nr:hypothetical protein [bacterium]